MSFNRTKDLKTNLTLGIRFKEFGIGEVIVYDSPRYNDTNLIQFLVILNKNRVYYLGNIDLNEDLCVNSPKKSLIYSYNMDDPRNLRRSNEKERNLIKTHILVNSKSLKKINKFLGLETYIL